ncbi:MAG TPA: hypothetical protein VIN37_00945 [Candidatus Limnocylindria bacterium]
MTLRRGLAARRQLDDLHVDEVASAGEVRERAASLEPWPGCEVELEEVEAEPLVDRDVLAQSPLVVGVDEETRLAHARECSLRMV